MHVMIALFQLSSCVAVNNFKFAEGTVGFWVLEILGRCFECFFESLRQETMLRDI